MDTVYVNPLSMNVTLVTFKNSVLPSKKTHSTSLIKSNQLTMLRETLAVYCENQIKAHTSTYIKEYTV